LCHSNTNILFFRTSPNKKCSLYSCTLVNKSSTFALSSRFSFRSCRMSISSRPFFICASRILRSIFSMDVIQKLIDVYIASSCSTAVRLSEFSLIISPMIINCSRRAYVAKPSIYHIGVPSSSCIFSSMKQNKSVAGSSS